MTATTEQAMKTRTYQNDSDEDKVSNNGKGYKSIESDDDNQESGEAGISMITRPSTAALVIDCNTQGNSSHCADQTTSRNVQEHLTGHSHLTAVSQGFPSSHSKHVISYDRNWETKYPW